MSSTHCLAPIVAAPPYRCRLWRCHGFVIVPSRAGHQGCVPYPCTTDRARHGRMERGARAAQAQDPWYPGDGHIRPHRERMTDIGSAPGTTDVAGDASLRG